MENKRVILDSNVFIAFYFADDHLHEKASSLIKTIEECEIILPYCVIQEVSTILAYRLGKKKADDFLSDVQKAANVLIISNDPISEIKFYKKFKQKMAFTDLALIYLAKEYDAMLFTFDKQLLNLYKKHIT